LRPADHGLKLPSEQSQDLVLPLVIPRRMRHPRIRRRRIEPGLVGKDG